MPGRFELKPTLEKIWHAPDNFRLMDPLPPMHRRGIIIAAIVLMIGISASIEMKHPTRRWSRVKRS